MQLFYFLYGNANAARWLSNAFVLVCILLFNSLAYASENTCKLVYPIVQDLQVFEDSSAKLRFEDLQSQILRPLSDTSFGLSKSNFWVKAIVTVPPNCSDTTTWFLQITPPYTDIIDVYLTENNKISSQFSLGDTQNQTDRRRLPLVPLKQGQQQDGGFEQTVWVKLSGQNGLAIKMTLITDDILEAQERKAWIIFIFTLALSFILILMSLTNFVFFKDIGYIYFSLLTIGTLNPGILIYGFSNIIFPIGAGDKISTISQTSNALMIFLLAQSTLKLKKHLPKINRIYSLYFYTLLLWTILTVVIGEIYLSLRIVHLSSSILLGSLLVFSIFLWKKESFSKLFFIIYLSIFLSYTIQILGLHGIINKNGFTDNAPGITLLIDVVFLFLAINYGQTKEREKNALTASLAEKNRVEVEQKRLFVNLLSHEIRTPLAIMSAANRNLFEEKSSLSDFLQKSLSKQKVAIDKISDVLDLCLTQERMKQFNSSHLVRLEEVWVLLTQHIDELTPSTSQTITCLYDTKTSKPVEYINLYQEGFLMAFDLILSNAIKYSPENSTIVINMVVNKTQVNISITDQGIGFNEELLTPKAFKRGENTTGTSGLGLGLVIAKEIIATMNSQLLLENAYESGKVTGAKVSIVLPKSMS
ncbi:sensor histidine kinase [Marinomonas sp. IMCC 4694]|uniref:sensor histidine kinase n=1 Tax=Marinomonas sp. IMCC 4694 TaxID=2605432 RepID=UPI0011E77FAE|nr:sensor histidine kinase [Marinomonas sp. IMCC 4694]TYL46940.1 hypothetical protein FXV75_02725 [Marinomonas sp. IMCC 4694]